MISRIVATGLLLLTVPMHAYGLTGREVAERMDAVDTSQSREMVNTMVITRGKQTLVRRMEVKVRKFEGVEKQYIRFFQPAEVRDTSYLSWNYTDIANDDDMWVYMPAESLVRRVSGGGKKGPFMRSDFANEDITKREVEDDSFTYLRKEALHGVECHVIEAVPVQPDKSGYSKRILWIRSDIWLPGRIEYFDKSGRSTKERLVGGYRQIQGIWTATRQKMTSIGRNSSTMLESDGIQYNVPLSDSLFEQSNLKR